MAYVIVSIVLLSNDALSSGTYLSKFPMHRSNIMLFYRIAVLKEMEISRAQNFLLYLVQSTEFPFSFSLEDGIFGLKNRITISYQSGAQNFHLFESGAQNLHLF